MRELIIYTGIFFEPDKNAAGKRVLGNAMILESLGYDVMIIGKNSVKRYPEKKEYSSHIWFESFPDYGRIRYKGYLNYLKQIINTLDRKPICIIRYGSPGLSIFDYKLLRLAHCSKIKVVADVVDWLSADSGNLFFDAFKTVDTYLEKAIFNCMSDGIIAISHYLANYYKKRGKKVVIIPPVVCEYKKNEARNDEVKFIYSGIPFRLGVKVKNVHKIKDRLDIAVLAFAELYMRGIKSFVFDIFGITKEQYLVAFPEHNGFLEQTEGKIRFHGHKPMKDIQNELNVHDFSILFREVTRGTMAGFSTKVVESMSCGTPVVTTRTSDLDNYIVSGRNGVFVDIDDKEKLISQLSAIIGMSTYEIGKIKDACFTKKQFKIDQFKPEMERLLSQII